MLKKIFTLLAGIVAFSNIYGFAEDYVIYAPWRTQAVVGSIISIETSNSTTTVYCANTAYPRRTATISNPSASDLVALVNSVPTSTNLIVTAIQTNSSLCGWTMITAIPPTLTNSSNETVYLDNNMGNTTVSVTADAAITTAYRCNDASTKYVNTKMVTAETGVAIKKNVLPTNFTLTYSDGSQSSVSVPGNAVDLSLTFFPGATRTCTDSSGQSHITYSYGAKVIKVNQ